MSKAEGTVRTAAIVGAGTMGRRIAYACAARGVGARLHDVSGEALAEALPAVHLLLEAHEGRSVAADRRAAADRSAPGLAEARSLVEACDDLEACVRHADWVIETVPEDLELKRTVLARIGAAAPAHAFIASNTSSLPGSWLAESTGRPARFTNMNFGTPEHLKVEVMGHPGTAPETTEAARRFLRQLGLVPIVARREIQGYPTNRIWRAIKKEVLHLIDGGYLSAEEIDRAWMLDWGTPIGPCGLMDMVGLDVVRDIENVYHEASGDPSDRPPEFLERMVERGELGVKSGKGFYSYPSPAFERETWLTNPDD